MKKSAKMLRYSGLDCGMLEFFTHKPQSKDFPAFLETGLVEEIAVCDHTTRDPNRLED
jgi:hypothetical protein